MSTKTKAPWAYLNDEEIKLKNLNPENKSGYLNENYHLFYIKDKKEISFNYHYHDFHKLVVLIHGKVNYEIEGKSYELKNNDILLVPMHKIHRPVIDPSVEYERLVLWISDAYFDKFTEENTEIKSNILKASLIRLKRELTKDLQKMLMDAYHCGNEDAFGAKILADSHMEHFLVSLFRLLLSPDFKEDFSSITYDPKIDEIISYINKNLKENLSNDDIATRFYMSKYYLMHKFKEETGYSLHNYIEEKRLINATALLNSGKPVAEAFEQSGFKEYTTFLRAFKKKYRMSPSSYTK
ncbi:MAG: AraC family transcriptional regulator [Lachnospiraceae bacterium]|nr:AraC family transcriptional regulator [Lachnospiraceae bacterium]